MSIYIIPPRERGEWAGTFPGREFGDIQESFNADLIHDRGRLLLSKRAFVEVSTDSLATLDLIYSFIRSNASGSNRLWASGFQGDIFYSAALNSPYSFAKDVSTGVPSDALDLGIHEEANGEGRLIVTRGSDLALLNSDNHANSWINSWWTGRNIVSSTDATPISIESTGHGFITGDKINISGHETNVAANGTWIITKTDVNNFTLDDSVGSGAGAGGATGTCGYLNQTAILTPVPHPTDTFNRTSILGDDRYIHTIDKNDAVQYRRIILPHGMRITHIFHTKTRAWILTYNTLGGDAAVYEWDGFSPTYLNEHRIDDHAVMSGCEWFDTPVIVTARGKFKIYNGSTFQDLEAKLPIFEEGNEMSYATFGSENIKPRGMVNRNGILYINIKAP
ncbi:hypothetical protein LCGC14_1976640 [marine sediment metagenome]|uniref:Uncharacterized protein n=1 Tax=marine sediment metagenome TaxID=412755 RepID=A0A0F9FYE1_9ZZZZ